MSPVYNVRQCKEHYPIDHHDWKAPWCNACGLTEDFQRPERVVPEWHPDAKTPDKPKLDVQNYVVKPARMEVLLLTQHNLEAAARWTGGEVMTHMGEEVQIESSYLAFPTMAGLFNAYPGMFLARMEDGKFCCIDREDLEANWVSDQDPINYKHIPETNYPPNWLEN